MKTRIVRIGNSQGIRIPKPLIEQSGLTEDVVILVEGNTLVIKPASRPRDNWEETFQSMAETGDDMPLDEESPKLSSWDDEDWEW
jgi:antitoxin MazE